MKSSFNERRKHLRIYRNLILTYHEKNKPDAKHTVSQVKNISKGGLNFLSTYRLTQGAIITVDLKVPFMGNPLRLDGTVLECKEKIPDMIYETRIQFQEIPQEVLMVLEKIESYGSPKKG